jgi:hypothetical protein
MDGFCCAGRGIGAHATRAKKSGCAMAITPKERADNNSLKTNIWMLHFLAGGPVDHAIG